MKWGWLLGTLIWFAPFTGAAELGGAFNIFGADQRVPVLERRFPFTAIGYLNSHCTGTLVAPQYVLTAAHCVYDSAKKARRKDLTHFYPGLINGVSSLGPMKGVAVVTAWWGTNRPEADRAHDWAIVKLASPLPDPFLLMAFRPVMRRVSLVGFSADLRVGAATGVIAGVDHRPIAMSAHFGCYVRETFDDLFLHDCHAKRGSSGGPMLTRQTALDRATGARVEVWTLVGLNVAEYRGGAPDSLEREFYTEEYANLGINVRGAMEKLNLLLGRAPSELLASP